jgi:O-acetyl-ADP-ribose deacetylase (regulator of RNase III)
MEDTQAIVNAANSQLRHGGGLAAAISRAGGKDINMESKAYIKEHGSIPTGMSGHTSGGNMSCKFVIHTVGPIYHNYSPEEANYLLQSSILNSLLKAKELGVESVSVPAISSGIFGFPKDKCAEILLTNSVKMALLGSEQTGSLKKIRLCNFDSETVNEFKIQF